MADERWTVSRPHENVESEQAQRHLHIFPEKVRAPAQTAPPVAWTIPQKRWSLQNVELTDSTSGAGPPMHRHHNQR